MAQLTPKCEEFLLGFWDKKDIDAGLQDPLQFVRNIVNPFL